MELGRFELCLNVTDLEASTKFYRNLGFESVRGNPDQGWLVLKNSNLIVALYQGHIPSNLLNFRGQDVSALSSELEKRGLTFEEQARVEDDGSVGSFLKDPDGNTLYFNTGPED